MAATATATATVWMHVATLGLWWPILCTGAGWNERSNRFEAVLLAERPRSGRQRGRVHGGSDLEKKVEEDYALGWVVTGLCVSRAGRSGPVSAGRMAGELAGSKVKAMEEESEREGVGEGAITQGDSVNCEAYGRS